MTRLKLIPALLGISLVVSFPTSSVWSEQNGITKYIDVFGVPVNAESCVSNRKLLHVARVLAEYLDNNNNGKVDNKRVVRQLKKKRRRLCQYILRRRWK